MVSCVVCMCMIWHRCPYIRMFTLWFVGACPCAVCAFSVGSASDGVATVLWLVCAVARLDPEDAIF
eukprot:6436474-Prorocentrum_lima.AAC.1